MNILYDFEDDSRINEGLLAEMENALELVLKRENVRNEDLQLSLTFVSEEEIREINGMYRNMDKVTDVLSFPQFNCAEEIPECGNLLLGDVVICMDVAQRQAEEYGHSFQREVMYLFVHSLFHLMGYDHMEDDEKTEMRQAEEEIMNMLNLAR